MPNTFTKAPVAAIDTIVENRRFFAYMTGLRATDWFYENGQDYLDSRARWDVGGRLLFGTENFNVGTGYIGAAWVAPFACTLKGFTAVGVITTGDHDWEASLLWHDATYPITDLNIVFANLVIEGTSGATDDDASIITGTCEQALATGDLVLPAVRRDGYSTTESLYGSFSFWFERIND